MFVSTSENAAVQHGPVKGREMLWSKTHPKLTYFLRNTKNYWNATNMNVTIQREHLATLSLDWPMQSSPKYHVKVNFNNRRGVDISIFLILLLNLFPLCHECWLRYEWEFNCALTGTFVTFLLTMCHLLSISGWAMHICAFVISFFVVFFLQAYYGQKSLFCIFFTTLLYFCQSWCLFLSFFCFDF